MDGNSDTTQGNHDKRVADVGFAGISRRNFLKGSGAFLGASFLASSAVVAAGCASEKEKAPASGTSDNSSSAATEFDTFSTDVLVVGCGIGGTLAAVQAYKEGCQVTVVDKGPFKASGVTGMNWEAGVYKFGMIEGRGNWVDGFSNMAVSAKIDEWIGTSLEPWNLALTFVRLGSSSLRRNEDGSLYEREFDVEGVFSRHAPEYLGTHTDIDVLDNTMITGLCISDGICTGAIGVHVPTGRYRVIRAKATVIADGGSTQMFGWSGTGAISINVPDNTGDADMAAFRNGCSLIGTEFFSSDMVSIFPPAIGGSFAAGIGADAYSTQYVMDNQGKYFLGADSEGHYLPITTQVAQAILDGRGSEHDGVYVDLTQPGAAEQLRWAYGRNIEMWKNTFGIDVTAPGYKVEIGIEAFEHMGSPVVDENAMTQIPGLFNVRGLGNMMGVSPFLHFLPPYAGYSAASYALDIDDDNDSSADWASVEEEIMRLEGILNAGGNKRPHEIRHAIQNAVYGAFHVGADADRLNTALAEIQRIKSEDMPQMAVTNKTRCYNTEWRMAIENVNLLELSEATLQASLMREESRMFFFRSDFPETDDENWMANILVNYDNGDFEYEIAPIAVQ